MKKIGVPLALVALSTLVALLCFELLLRATGYSSPVFRGPHPELGWSLRPGVEGWWTGEGRSYVKINAAGWRDREHGVAKPAGVYRVVVLGDSYSEAMHVDQGKTYWSHLEGLLSQCLAKPVEVLNFSVAGYGTGQQYLVLRNTALKYHPDVVLLQFTNGNDVSDNSRALAVGKDRPFFTLDASGKLTPETSFQSDAGFQARLSARSDLIRRATDHSRTLQMVRSVANAGIISSAVAKAGEIEAGLDMAPLAPPRSPQWEEAWRVTERLIEETRNLAAKHGARFVLAMVPYAIQVHPDPRTRAAVQDKLEVADLFYPEKRLARLPGVDVIALAPEMQRMAQSEQRPLHGFDKTRQGFGHWNEDGHRVGAEIIARRLCGT